MQIILTQTEIQASRSLLFAIIAEKDLGIGRDQKNKIIVDDAAFQSMAHNTWIESGDARYMKNSSDGSVTIELCSAGVHLMKHLEINIGRYGRVVAGVFSVAKAFKFALMAFDGELKKLKRFINGMDQNAMAYDYKPYDSSVYIESLISKSTKDLVEAESRIESQLADADQKQEIIELLSRLQVLQTELKIRRDIGKANSGDSE